MNKCFITKISLSSISVNKSKRRRPLSRCSQRRFRQIGARKQIRFQPSYELFPTYLVNSKVWRKFVPDGRSRDAKQTPRVSLGETRKYILGVESYDISSRMGSSFSFLMIMHDTSVGWRLRCMSPQCRVCFKPPSISSGSAPAGDFGGHAVGTTSTSVSLSDSVKRRDNAVSSSRAERLADSDLWH